MQEENIIAFLQKAKTRGGFTFLVEFLEKDSSGKIAMLKGYVNEMADSAEVKIPMYWYISGVAVSSTPLKYDLIEVVGINYGQQGGDATHEPPPNEPNPPQG